MSVCRVGATSFVYENQLFVAGGCDSSVIEVSITISMEVYYNGMNVLPHYPTTVSTSAQLCIRTTQFFSVHAMKPTES